MRHRLFALMLSAVVGPLACGSTGGGGDEDRTSTSGAMPGSSGQTSTGPATPPPEPSSALDILFVIDDSGSMAEEQKALAEGIDALLRPLANAGLSVRVATTTTDDSNPWCRTSADVSEPESGQFITSSCRDRLGEFSLSGDEGQGMFVCTDVCAPDTSLDLMGDPWLEVGDVDAATDALRCLLPQGITGCGFESTLESTRKALSLTGNEAHDEFGFIRPQAHLAVVFLTDEADCSFNPLHEQSVFGEAGVGDQVFWSLPDLQDTPTSAVCWNAGITCDFDLPADQCRSVDKDVDGSDAADPDRAVMYPVERFREPFEQLREEKRALGADVFVFGLVGVPENYTGLMRYAPGPDSDSPDSFQARYGIGPGCSSTVAEAVPPVRIREFVEGSAWGPNGRLYSICNEAYGPALADMANVIASFNR